MKSVAFMLGQLTGGILCLLWVEFVFWSEDHPGWFRNLFRRKR